MLRIGNTDVTEVSTGSTPVQRIYSGSDLVWEAESWDFHDDFERTSIGSAWSGSGAVIDNGALKKNTSAGEAIYFSTQQFSSDDFTIEVRLGPVQDLQQFAGVGFGSANNYITIDFNQVETKAVYYDGISWIRVLTFPVQVWDEGDILRWERRGTRSDVWRNGTHIGTFYDSHGMGAGNRSMRLTVNMALNFFLRFYGPTFDDVRVRAN